MNINFKNRKALVNGTCIILMLIMVALQFTPFWRYGDENEITTSINGYIWFPTNHKELTSYLQENVRKDFEVDQILLMPIFNLIAGFAGILLCLMKSYLPVVRLLPAACGLVGIWGFMTEPAFRLGENWMLHLLICILLLIVAGGSLLDEIRQMKAEKK